jgi:hypothetical protein
MRREDKRRGKEEAKLKTSKAKATARVNRQWPCGAE